MLAPAFLLFRVAVSASYAAPVPDRRQVPAAPHRLPPQSFFLVSAVFHYLGPSLAVLLFARVDVLGVAWLRIASAAVVFTLWRRPWRLLGRLSAGERWNLVTMGLVLAVMNSVFYLAVDRLPLSTVGAIEFLGTVILAAAGARTRRNAGALLLTTAGVVTITSIRITGQPLGLVFAFANCALFMLYILLRHRSGVHGGRVHHPLDPHHRSAARLRLRLRQLRAVYALHPARPPDGERRRPPRRAGRTAGEHRPARGGHGGRGGRRDAV